MSYVFRTYGNVPANTSTSDLDDLIDEKNTDPDPNGNINTPSPGTEALLRLIFIQLCIDYFF